MITKTLTPITLDDVTDIKNAPRIMEGVGGRAKIPCPRSKRRLLAFTSSH